MSYFSLIIALSIYLAPMIVALIKRNNRTKVILFNIFLGWTVVMWIMSMVWACRRSEPTPTPVTYYPPQPPVYPQGTQFVPVQPVVQPQPIAQPVAQPVATEGEENV